MSANTACHDLDHQSLVVGRAVVVGPASLEHDIDDAQQLVCARDDGALVAAPGGKGAVVGFELAPLRVGIARQRRSTTRLSTREGS